MTEQERYNAWREVDKEFLRNTAADMVKDYFDGMCHEDILGELGYKTWDGMLINLAVRFEHAQDCNVAENDTWISVIEQRKKEALELAKAKSEEKMRQEMRNVIWICRAYDRYVRDYREIPGATAGDIENIILEAAQEFGLRDIPDIDYPLSITGFAIEKFNAEAQKRNPIKEGEVVRVLNGAEPFTDLDWVLDNVTYREKLKRWIGAVIDAPDRYYRLYTVQEIVGDKALCKSENDDVIVLELKDLRTTNAKGDE